MFEALRWATVQLIGVSFQDVTRPRHVMFWLAFAYGLLGLCITALGGLAAWIFSFSPVLSALASVALYCFLCWKCLPVSHGGAYLLAVRLVGSSGLKEYDDYRRLALYLGLLAMRVGALFLLNLFFGAAWYLPVILLSGCFVIEGMNQTLGRRRGAEFRASTWTHWMLGVGLTLIYAGIYGVLTGHGGLLILALLVSALSLCGSLQAGSWAMEALPVPVRRRIFWTVSELAMLLFGLFALML